MALESITKLTQTERCDPKKNLHAAPLDLRVLGHRHLERESRPKLKVEKVKKIGQKGLQENAPGEILEHPRLPAQPARVAFGLQPGRDAHKKPLGLALPAQRLGVTGFV